MHPLCISLRRHGREALAAGLDLLLPPACPACGDPSVELCEPCRRQLARRPEAGCGRCGEPIVPGVPCAGRHESLRNVRQLVAPLRFVGSGGRLVRRFKLDGDASAGRLLAREMADAWRVSGAAVRPVLVPVPLHRARLRRRGFDQARWLAQRLGERLRLRVAAGALRRVRATRPQGDALVRSRAENVRGAFAVRRPRAVRGRDVLLVDDVFTTGATARACASLLRDAGARSVSLLVACHS
ncbi:MAG: ComF family protein [Planctomycetes bacterium]|nr:ComF family protein [Planctomycetota bacterium]